MIEIPEGYVAKMRLQIPGGMKMSRFLKPPSSSKIETNAVSSGFNHKVNFPSLKKTKFYKIIEKQQELWQTERECMNMGGSLPIVSTWEEAKTLEDVSYKYFKYFIKSMPYLHF